MISSRTAAPRLRAVLAATAVVAGLLVVVAPSAGATGPSTVTQTFAYTGATTTFTVPVGITQLTLTALGAQGGLGGRDAAGFPPAGGYQGAVTGTIAVTAGQVLTIAVGQGGASGAAGHGSNVPANYLVGAAVGGSNPLSTYGGGNGGVAGPQGSSGFGAGGGAATVITTSGTTIVAGGSGGSGGSGQFTPTLGRLPYATYTGRSDITSTVGQLGITVATVCNNAPSPGCDGGGSGGGGGGAQGGAQGQVQFGSGTSNEWFGYGGYPGQNSTGGLSGLSATYQSFSTNNGGGSVTISYVTGPPDVPTAVSGIADNASADLSWTAPVNVGASALTDYVIQYAPASSPTSWTTFSDGVSTSTATIVTGLTNGTAYVFQVAAVNAVGQGSYSASSGSITPYGPPTAPTITTITPADGQLSVAFSAATSGGPILDYQYQINGVGPWVSSGATSSPLSVTGLVNGTTYSVAIRAVNSVGVGAASAPMSGTPAALPGAPSISSASTAIGTATLVFTPGYDGGSPITNYEYQLGGGSWVSAGTTVSPMTVTGLANGTTYAVALRAVNASGAGAASQATTVVTPDVPAAPTVTSIVPGDTTLSIAFTPGNSNGLTVTSYQYQLTSAGSWTTAPSTSSPIVVTGLTNGTTYTVRVRAVNALGAGAGSTAQSATPATVPGAPTIVGSTVAGANQQLSAGFTAPASDGGSAITTYEYSTDAGVTWATRSAGSTASPVVIATLSSDGTTPLVNGTTYFVELRAVNAVGAGQASAVASGIAQTSPAAPSITSVVPGPSSLQVTFTPASNGGAAITGYEYRLGSGSWTDTGTLASTFLIDSLTNGTTYAVSVRAVNSQGSGDPSSPVSGTPFTAPDQPSITGVIRLDRTLTVAVAPGSDGGSPITGWQYSTDGGTTWQSAGTSASPLTITTLSSDGTTRIANGTSYPISVRDVNAAGASAPSAITSVGPGTTPSAPVVTLTPSSQSIQVGYTVASNGGSPISDVQYRINGGSWLDAGSLTSPFSIGSLINGTAYTIEVRAVNALGAGAASTPASATPLTVPDPPTTVTAVSNTASADVTWTAPGFNGGSTVTGYVATGYATSSSTTPLATCTTATTACSITGLTNGTTYYVSVVAQNAAGSGQPSAPRAVVTPLARPGAPTLNTLSAGDTSLTLAFTAGSAGSSPITGYQYQLNGGAWQNASGTTSPMTFSGLTNGTNYSVVLRAVSAAGVGTASTPLTATPFTFPDAPDPAFIVANGTNASIVVSWTAPNSNGSPITGYTATAFTAALVGTQAGTCTTAGALTCTISGLANGTTYYVSLQAQNAAGLSVRSAPRVPATPSLQPGAVSGVTGVSGNGQVALSWTPGSTGGAAISDYTIWYSSGGAYTQFVDGTSTAATTTVTGLTNGTAYTFVVYAVNSNGTGPISAASSPVTPLAPGTVPVESAATSVAGGFTFTITNYSAATTYTLSPTGGATATRSGAAVTVSGLGSGAASTVTVAAALLGNTNTSSTVTGSALITGVAPTFSTATRTVDGYTFQITNYVPSATYTFSATNGATVNATGSSVVVSGLAAGVSSTVTVTVALAGYTNASAVESGTALAAGTVPLFSGLTSTAGGFTFTIANYQAGLVYTYVATNGATVTQTGSLVVVSGLAPTASSAITVTATDPGLSTAQGGITGSALSTGVAPILSAPVAAAGGFAVDISNYSGSYAYSASATAGGVATVLGASVTVTGLAPGASSTVTVTAVRSGYTTTSASVTGAALLAGTAPTFTTPMRTTNGFTVTITNYDPAQTYSLVATGGATVTRVGSTITVTGLAPAASSDVTVTVALAEHTNASAVVSGAALFLGVVPILSTPVSAAGGFSFDISNFSLNDTYTASTTGGVATVSGSLVTVTGLADGASPTVTVTASRSGYTTVSASVVGSALFAGKVPTFSAPVSTPDGFTFTITDFDPATTYSLVATNGATVTLVGSTVTVSGLGASASSDVTVTASLAGSRDASGSINGGALFAGVVPILSASVAADGGFSFDISNFSLSDGYSASATSGVATVSGSTVTVTGLADGASSTVTVNAARSGYTTTSASRDGTSLPAGTAPTFSTPVSTADGFTVDIANYGPTATYAVVATNGATVTLTGSTITVTGLGAGESSEVTVTADVAGYATASASVDGSALLAGAVPTFSAPVGTPDGFTVDIANFDPAVTYSFDATNGATVTQVGATVTVTGLAPGASSTVTATATLTGSTTTSADVSGSALLTGTAPTFAAPVSTSDGFTVDIANYDPTATYSLTATGGATVTQVGSTITVSGLAAGTSCDVTVSTSVAGFTDASATVSGSALLTGVAPTLSAPSSTADGFTVDITNYSGSYTYSASATNSAVATVLGSSVTVTGLAPGASSTVTVTAVRSGYTTTSTPVTGSALLTGTSPTFSAPVSTSDGFMVDIANYDPAVTYAFVATGGATVTQVGSTVTVTGLTPGASSTLTATAALAGYRTGSADVTGSALFAGVVPILSPPVGADGGFSFDISNFSLTDLYSVSATDGVATVSGSTVTVTGLADGASSTVTVTGARPGYTTTSASASGSALLTGTTPTFASPVSTADGFTVDIANYDPTATYASVATNGVTVTRTGSTVTVAGLTPGGSSVLTVTADAAGYTTASASVPGSALLTGSTPTFSAPVSTPDGFTVDVANYDPAVTYSFVATNGATVTQVGATVTVTGLAPGASSTVTASATLAGSTTATATVTGSALLAGITPTFSGSVAADGAFSFDISNFSPNDSYTLSANNGGIATLTGSTVTVTGLADGASSVVTVTAARSGYTNASATTSGTALLAGTAPTFSAPVQTSDGFGFDITNYDPTATYTVTASNGGMVAVVGGSVVVSGLGTAGWSDVTVTVSHPGDTDASASLSGGALLAGVVPILATPVSADGGFSFDISNFSLNDAYTASATGGVVTVSGSTVTVTGLADGASSTVTVTAARSGYTTVSADAVGTALLAGTVPTFSTPVSTTDGYTFTITNYDPTATYTLVATNGGTVTRNGAVVTVTGLDAATPSTVTVTDSASGQVDATATVSGTSGPAATPTPTPTPTPVATPTASATSTATSTPTSSATPSSGGTASSTGTSTHPSNQAPTVPEQPTGTGAVTISGVGVDSTLTSSGTTVNLSGHGLLMQLTVTLNGHDVTLSSDHVVRVPQEGALRVAIRGFKPGTPATVWGFSTPTILTRLTIAADRSGVQAFTLPASMLPGPHTLVVAGTSAEGKPATMSVGILVTAPSAASAVTQGAGLVAPAAGASWWWLLVVAAVLGFGFFLLVWRRRKKDDEESVAA